MTTSTPASDMVARLARQAPQLHQAVAADGAQRGADAVVVLALRDAGDGAQLRLV